MTLLIRCSIPLALAVVLYIGVSMERYAEHAGSQPTTPRRRLTLTSAATESTRGALGYLGSADLETRQ
jgi:hypothetical protein